MILSSQRSKIDQAQANAKDLTTSPPYSSNSASNSMYVAREDGGGSGAASHSVVGAAASAAAGGTPALPVFLKFHKVGGTTIASCLRDREENGDLPAKNYWCCDKLWMEVAASEAAAPAAVRGTERSARQQKNILRLKQHALQQEERQLLAHLAENTERRDINVAGSARTTGRRVLFNSSNFDFNRGSLAEEHPSFHDNNFMDAEKYDDVQVGNAMANVQILSNISSSSTERRGTISKSSAGVAMEEYDDVQVGNAMANVQILSNISSSSSSSTERRGTISRSNAGVAMARSRRVLNSIRRGGGRGGGKDDGTNAEEGTCGSGGVAYEHNTLPIYKEHGLRGFAKCTSHRPRVVALTVLRDPVTKWLSGLYYWGKVYTNPRARICLARNMFADVREDIAEAYRRLIHEPSRVEVRDVDLMSSCIYGDRFTETQWPSLTHLKTLNGTASPQGPKAAEFASRAAASMSANAALGRVWRERGIPGPPGGAPPNEYLFYLNPTVENATAPTEAEVATAKERLARDFVVGVTEDMPSFLALIAVRLNWPLHFLCCVARNVNHQTGARKSQLGAHIFQHARQKLWADIQIYEFAKDTHANQVRAAGVKHTETIREISDPKFQIGVCGHELDADLEEVE
eukprot:CAMPEP_0171989406 /NCGR_PEP_ID=MMETSP0993-20121228/276396_1 /TAXON_ID=483369 /ORGANISM="non described non described, Strain CCMP2098" /LENGTH=631 /DNA_ID=CAMNT_0012642397 /DNA_START=366 /DNA_END=2262 /DNA_ORIENTATION=-